MLLLAFAIGCGDNGDNDAPPRCGDGVVDSGEQCDDGSANSNTLPDTCRTSCKTPTCGDGVVDNGETCDDGADNSDTDPTACNTDCTMTSMTCGDGVVDAGEQCDDGAANSDTNPDACRTNCKLAKCGDGVMDGGEACDDGAANSNTQANACRTTCALPSCGDGAIDTGEICDDGAANSDSAADACRTSCVLPRCGDGAIDTGETCDEGTANSNTVPNACRTTCTIARCGDGVIDTGESCDNGPANSNTVPGACRTTCAVATCGDGVVDAGETCDNGTANSDTTPNACREACVVADCGDGVVDTGEQCDMGMANSDTQAGACRTTCVPARCGDGVVDTGEQCDDGAQNSDSIAGACRTTCRVAGCGDGILDTGEACDDGAANGDTPDACRATCELPTCGDGIVDSGEQCDLGSGNSNAAGSQCMTTCRGLWKFVSMPDLLSYDVGDVSSLTALVNSTNPFHEQAINLVLDAVAAENPDFVLVAGDLVGGNWHSDADMRQVFGPVTTVADKATALGLAADTYYPQWLARFATRGIPVHAALGDHELGNAPWPASFDRSQLVDEFKAGFAKHMTKAPGGAHRYTNRPVGTPYEDTAYAFKHKNMLVLTVDPFYYEPGANLGDQGTVALDIKADQMTWINQVFTAAAADPEIEYLVVQGHIPVIKPVRFQASTNLGLDNERTSAFWQALASAGVDLYLTGDMHAMSAKNVNGVEQVCHGGPMGTPGLTTVNYLVGSVYPDRMELTLKTIDISYDATNTNKLWQTGATRPLEQLALDTTNGFTNAGSMVIDHTGPTRVYRNRTGYFLPFQEQPPPALLVHLPLDQQTDGKTPNLGLSGQLNRGIISGATSVAGKFGSAIDLVPGQRVVAGSTPISSNWPRTVSLWVKRPAGGTGLITMMTFGRNAGNGTKWDMDIDLDNGGVVELGVASGRTDGVGTTSVTDGNWHHVAMVLPDGMTTIKQVVIYVDGTKITTTSATATAIVTALELADQAASSSLLILGHAANGMTTQQFTGQLDDVAIWSRALDAAGVKAISSLASTSGLAYDAGKVDRLLGAFAAQADITIGNITWSYQASGLTGAAGVVVQPTSGNQYELNLGGGAGFVVH
ncbi:MAG: hypothetical protein HOV81_41645 [Kofleriaceae bacterium]|nr:hypothetical protein [Kofleriaceae bacterium]